MMIRFGSRFEDDHPKSWRERLRGAFTGLAGMPQAFRLVWEAHPSLTLALALATLLQAFIAPASAWALLGGTGAQRSSQISIPRTSRPISKS